VSECEGGLPQPHGPSPHGVAVETGCCLRDHSYVRLHSRSVCNGSECTDAEVRDVALRDGECGNGCLLPLLEERDSVHLSAGDTVTGDSTVNIKLLLNNNKIIYIIYFSGS